MYCKTPRPALVRLARGGKAAKFLFRPSEQLISGRDGNWSGSVRSRFETARGGDWFSYNENDLSDTQIGKLNGTLLQRS